MRKRILLSFSLLIISLCTVFAQADKVIGEYQCVHDGVDSRIKIFKYEDGYRAQCVWVSNLKMADGTLRRDVKNPDPAKRKVTNDKIVLIDKVKFGKYSTDTGMDGFAKTEAKVMIIHGELDNTVPQDYGYDLYFEKYKNDPDFIFEYRKGCDHNNILNNNVIKDIIAFCDENMA